MTTFQCTHCIIGEDRQHTLLEHLGAIGMTEGKMLEIYRCSNCGAIYGRPKEEETSTDEDFKFEYRSATGSRIRNRINRALLSGSDQDLAKVFHIVADNAFEFGQREENEACALSVERSLIDVKHATECECTACFWNKTREAISGKIRARLEKK